MKTRNHLLRYFSLLLAGALLVLTGIGVGCAASFLPPKAVITVESATVPAGVPVALDGSKSTDPNKLALAYSWSLDSIPPGSKAQLEGETRPSAFFTPDLEGDYVVSLIVSDGVLSSEAVTKKITAGPCGASVPTIESIIPAPAMPGVGAPVQLTANVKDADMDTSCAVGDALTYAWSFAGLPLGSKAELNGDALTAPSFTPDVPGDYDISLTVTDRAGHTATTVTTVTASVCGSNPPVVSMMTASPAAPATGQLVTLSATVTDADTMAPCMAMEHFTYTWALVAAPAGSVATIQGDSLVSPTITPDLDGVYTVELTVTDTDGHRSAVGSIDITAAVCGSNPPVAEIAVLAPFGVPAPAPPPPAAAVQAPVNGAVQLDASTSNDADNLASCGLTNPQKLSYAWTFVNLPNGSHSAFNDPTAVNASFTPDVPGLYSIKLVVSDGTGRTGIANVAVNGFNAAMPVGFGIGPYTSLALDATTQEPRIAFFDNAGGIKRGIHLAACTGATCATTPVWAISPIELGIGHHPSIVTAGNALHVAYWDNNNCAPKYAVSTDLGKNWTISTIQGNPQGCFRNVGCSCGGFNCNGNPNNAVDWRDNGAFPVLTVSNGTPIVAFVTYVQGAAVTCMGSGNNFVLPGYDQVSYAVCTAGCNTATPTWSVTTAAAGPTGGNNRIGYLSMAVDPVSMQPSIAFRTQDNGQGRSAVGYISCTNGCATATPTFSAPAWIDLDRGFDGYLPDSIQTEATTNSLAIGSMGQAFVAIFDRANQWLRLSSCTTNCTTATNWSGIVVDAVTPNIGGFASLALSTTPATLDLPRIAYWNTSVNVFRYAQQGPGGWTLTNLDTGGNGSSVSLKLTPTDGARTSYFHGNAVRYYTSGN